MRTFEFQDEIVRFAHGACGLEQKFSLLRKGILKMEEEADTERASARAV
jgi:hypothetical protein